MSGGEWHTHEEWVTAESIALITLCLIAVFFEHVHHAINHSIENIHVGNSFVIALTFVVIPH